MTLASKRKLIGSTALTVGIFVFWIVSALSGTVNLFVEDHLMLTVFLWIWLILSLLSKVSMMANQLRWPVQITALIAFCFVIIASWSDLSPIPQGQNLVMSTADYFMFVLMFGWPAIDMLDIYISLDLKGQI
jgi:hypothetical protein